MKGSQIAKQAAPHIRKAYTVKRSRRLWLAEISLLLRASWCLNVFIVFHHLTRPVLVVYLFTVQVRVNKPPIVLEKMVFVALEFHLLFDPYRYQKPAELVKFS